MPADIVFRDQRGRQDGFLGRLGAGQDSHHTVKRSSSDLIGIVEAGCSIIAAGLHDIDQGRLFPVNAH